MRLLPFGAVLVLGLSVVPFACGGDSDDSKPGGGGSTGDGSAASSGADGMISLDGTPSGDGQEGGQLGDGEACSAQTQKGKQYPLDMYIMMDESGSMTEIATGSTQSKWEAVIQALTSFLAEPNSAGMSVGIQFFPLYVTPTLTECDPVQGCSPANTALCAADGLKSHCYPLCSTLSGCGGAECRNTGAAATDYCTNALCDVNLYAQPQVEIAALPGSAQLILDAMNAHKPQGGTPTLPALKGAIQHAQGWATAHSDHKVIVVLATDGLPTLCPVGEKDPQVITQCAQTASAAAAANPSVKTFVIGVMKAGDDTQGDLNTIAAGGGTEKAFLIEPNQDVAQQFAKALAQIRGQALSCDFKLPEVDASTLDFHKVNVQISAGGVTQTAYYVVDVSQCDPKTGGWYYDTDPDKTVPTKIIMCPATCQAIKADVQTTVDIAIGCKTLIKPPA